MFRPFLSLILVGTLAIAKPLSYELASSTPPSGDEDTLVIALHGAAATAKFYCGLFVKGQYQSLAEDRHYMVVCPSGVGIRPMYEDYEDRILDLRANLLAQHPNLKKVFLTGHSLGGRGALLIGLRHPDKFDAIAAVAPALHMRKDQAGTSEALAGPLIAYPHRIFVGYAVRDIIAPLFPIDLGKLLLAGVGRLTIQPYNSDHWTVGAASAVDIFDFFDTERSR
jgi:pimeloyl-ACP methyl ester carboxylesterase